jgi:ribonuclease P protein component
VLSARHRLRHPRDFSAVIRHGARAGRSAVVLHLLLPDGAAGADNPVVPETATSLDLPVRVGFVVSKSVGNSVVRHRVVRRLRPLLAARIGLVPPGSRLVVRALPPAADATSVVLGEQVDSALTSAVRRASSRATSRPTSFEPAR